MRVSLLPEKFTNLKYSSYRARRNAQGHLEPDASDKDVQQSLGFGDYEMAPRAEIRNAQSGKS